MITECPNAHEGCSYFNRSTPGRLTDTQEHGCFASTDHRTPKFMGKGATALVRNYIRSTDNQQQLCRDEHDQKTVEEWGNHPKLPDDRYMIDALIALRKARKLGGK